MVFTPGADIAKVRAQQEQILPLPFNGCSHDAMPLRVYSPNRGSTYGGELLIGDRQNVCSMHYLLDMESVARGGSTMGASSRR